MSEGLQHLLVLLGVAACLGVVGWQGFKTLTLRGRGKLGACCAKGCHAGDAPPHDSKVGVTVKPAPVHFVPVELMGRRRR